MIAAGIRAAQAEQGVDLERFDTDQMLTLHQYNVFPNTTVLITADLLSVLCAKPGPDPDHAEMIAINFHRAPSADAPRTQPMTVALGDDQADLGFVLNADVSIAPAVQRGCTSPASRTSRCRARRSGSSTRTATSSATWASTRRR